MLTRRFKICVLAVATIGALLGIGAPASAAETNYVICSNAYWGGTLYCGYPYDYAGMSPSFTFSNGVIQSWGVAAAAGTAADHQAYTRWRNTDGSLSPWRSLGGKIYSNIAWVSNSAHTVVTIGGIGGDNRIWCNTRSSAATWSGWYRSATCDDQFTTTAQGVILARA